MSEQVTGGMPTDVESDDASEGGPRIDRPSRLVDEVVRRLREQILANKIPAGTKLVQTELAERMGVSRTPMREAIRLLEHEGLVQVSNGNRTVEVVSLSGRDLADLYQIREVVDGLAARLLAGRGLQPDVAARLEQDIHGMREALLPLRGEAFFVSHMDFHTTILRESGNRRLLQQLPLVRTTAAALRDEFPRHLRLRPGTGPAESETLSRKAHEEHVAIYNAVRRGDQDGAERAAREHIASAMERFLTKP
jgi:GntR family transcriptional regulator of vanillate catabolism